MKRRLMEPLDKLTKAAKLLGWSIAARDILRLTQAHQDQLPAAFVRQLLDYTELKDAPPT